MNFNFYLLKSLRILLFPLSLVYGLIIIVRNKFYDKNLLKSASFNLPMICIGNLSVGGTGKSPMVEYLLHLLQENYALATLSRGYKRKTKGYALAKASTTALDIGDEPMQFHQKFPKVAVAVGEERIEAIPQLLHDRPNTQVVLLDDAFQHRKIKAGLNVLLTEFSNLFTRDFFLPTGDLRDERASYKRAQIIVVTKCPPDLSEAEKEKTIAEIAPVQGQQVFFTTIEYGIPYHIANRTIQLITNAQEVLLVCGIANPAPLKEYLTEQAKTYYEQMFSDHHIFTIDDLKTITKRFDEIQSDQKMMITTEKDAVRLAKFDGELKQIPLYVLPVKHRFLFNEAEQFKVLVHTFIEQFLRQKRQHEQEK